MNVNKLRELELVFYPRSIAVVGASTDENKSGTRFLNALLKAGFKGKAYPVSRSGGTILGLKSYPTISSIPEPVDYVIIAVPSSNVLAVLDDCGKKGVKAVHIFTAGFRESGEEENRRLENQLVEKARNGGFRIIGPNCIGVCNPSLNMPYDMIPFCTSPGPVAIISQSGGFAEKVVTAGTTRGLAFSKVVSFGNGCDLDSLDFMEYFQADPETRFIGAYLEGIRDGRRFFKLLKEISPTKPVVVLKGGRTPAGNRTASSHTGSLASSQLIWSAALKQTGAIEVNSLTEFIDTLIAFQQLGHFEGRNVGIVSGFTDGGGGDSVIASDLCTAAGFNIPDFSRKTIEQLKSILPLAGSIFHNPFDISQASGRVDVIEQGMKLAIADPNIDFLLVHEHADQFDLLIKPESAAGINNLLLDMGKNGGKPMVMLLPMGLDEIKRLEAERMFRDAGILTFPTLEQAARTLMSVSRYFRNRPKASQPARD